MNLKQHLVKGLLLTLFTALLCVTSQAQSLYVLNNNKQLSAYEINDVKCMTFEDGKLMINENVLSHEISLADISYLSFNDYTSVNSISEEEKSTPIEKLNCYPNPCTSQINFELANLEGTIRIEILSTSGQLVLQEPGQNNTLNTINTSGLSKGIYLLKINSDKKTTIATFIKQ